MRKGVEYADKVPHSGKEDGGVLFFQEGKRNRPGTSFNLPKEGGKGGGRFISFNRAGILEKAVFTPLEERKGSIILRESAKKKRFPFSLKRGGFIFLRGAKKGKRGNPIIYTG